MASLGSLANMSDSYAHEYEPNANASRVYVIVIDLVVSSSLTHSFVLESSLTVASWHPPVSLPPFTTIRNDVG